MTRHRESEPVSEHNREDAARREDQARMEAEYARSLLSVNEVTCTFPWQCANCGASVAALENHQCPSEGTTTIPESATIFFHARDEWPSPEPEPAPDDVNRKP